MGKILIHAGMSPLEQPPLGRVFREKLFTTNSGNLLFQYTAYRTLMTEGTEFITRFVHRGDLSDAFIEQVNSECECAVLPLANNFRSGFNLLKGLTAFVKRLKIPCVVMGIGLQADSAAEIEAGFPFDDDVRAFVDAILDHSAQLGLRGELTGEYLKKLGYAPERHFTVIGCPSMYARGGDLLVPDPKPLTADSPIGINYRKEQPANLFAFVERTASEFPNYSLLFQRAEEMLMLRYGMPVRYDYRRNLDDTGLYPTERSHPAIRGGHAVGFASARAWTGFMAQNRFSIGCRIHGNIAAVLAGTPAMVFTIDTRTEELCRYHNIPFIPAQTIDEHTRLADLYAQGDFASVGRGHEQRFRHFVDFLNANGLNHIYRDTLSPKDVPFDRAVAALPEWGKIEFEPDISLPRRMERASLLWPRVRDGVGGRLRRLSR